MMKKLIVVFTVVLALTSGQAMALYVVDIGSPASEAGFSPVSWGPIQPDTSGGSWGGIASDPLSLDGKARVIWDGSDDDPSASLTFPTSITAVALRHLIGIANDSFAVDVSGNPWGSVTDVPSSSEVWNVSSFKGGTPGDTLTLTATDGKWASFDTYGQVAIDLVIATQPGETFQAWTFDNDDPTIPEIDLNNYGTPTATITGALGGPPPEWVAVLLDEEGVWQAEELIDIVLDIPNQMVRNPYKEIDLEIGFLGDLASFSVFPSPFGGSVELVSQDVVLVDAATGWKKLTASYLIKPNPDSESICYSFTGDIAAIDYIAVRTICVPEPLTIGLLGLGGLLLRRRTRRTA
ncbi:MAG: PEP-CTERM sorting domain-containing protein [Sedimentisphaerales bacterium]|nr:PEP-CTERM sorting domain-containing protein [Sedimentisphaerales bacterium]